MMTALATVAKVAPQGQMFDVELSCEQQTSCSSCSSQKSCGTGIVTKAVGNKSLHWHLVTDKAVEPGQVVEIGLPEKSVLQSAALVYLVPLLAMIAGALAGQWWLAPMLSMGEGLVIAVSILATLGGIWLAKRLSYQLEQRSSQQVTLLRVLGEPIS
ncbi:transcriptional regulator [Vibrio sp. JPW-9-11-11]|uniref:SoxR reducing system RseC family protein n=1 Tax=Vibrio sp. JPW-9-11-11 TaxID=1416532 RepID=UPI0015939956|nr:SoxR reducing system RseC family protein [Vibrio sp. JPW-9-11-11]NVD07497.1 transcriptional regulator [Vibrio sp. JPW-9-11-11]